MGDAGPLDFGRNMMGPSPPSGKKKRSHRKKKKSQSDSEKKTRLIKVERPPHGHKKATGRVNKDGNPDRDDQRNYAKCLVKSVECDGNLVVLMGECTACGTGNEVDVPSMDAKEVMEVECYKCFVTFFM